MVPEYCAKDDSSTAIEDDLWIRFTSTDVKCVTTGGGTTVGAASLKCKKDVPLYMVVAGNPARVIGQARRRRRELTRKVANVFRPESIFRAHPND